MREWTKDDLDIIDDYTDGLDVSVIAKSFGGGGHKHAAGFRSEVPLKTSRRPDKVQ